MIGTLAIDGWAVTFGTARRALGGLQPSPFSSLLSMVGAVSRYRDMSVQGYDYLLQRSQQTAVDTTLTFTVTLSLIITDNPVR